MRSDGSTSAWFSCSFDSMAKPSSSFLPSSSSSSLTTSTSAKKSVRVSGKGKKGTISTPKKRQEAGKPPKRLPVVIENDDDVVFVSETKPARPPKRQTSVQKAGADGVFSFVDRVPPKTADELAVHSKKVEQVREWLLDHRGSQRRSKALLLTGPCGCGKTATVKVLCTELHLELLEWESPDHYDLFYDDDGEEIIREKSQAALFADFLKSSDLSSLDELHAQKVVLIEQLPNVFYRDPSQLHSILRGSSLMQSVCMFVFVLSSVDSCWYLNPRRILPERIVREFHFHTIPFNASAPSFLQKALKRVVLRLRLSATPKQLKHIAEASDGDIRSAINNLQLCVDEKGRVNSAVQIFASSSQRDSFHCVAKMLYAKRRDEDEGIWRESEALLSGPLRKSHSRPSPPKDELQYVIDKSGMNGETLALYIDEHEMHFAVSLSEGRHVLENLCFMDSAMGRWECRKDTSLDGYEAQVAARSTLFYNYGFKADPRKGLYKLSKPQWRPLVERVETLRKEARSAFPFIPLADLFSTTLPLISKICPPMEATQRDVLLAVNPSFGGDEKGTRDMRLLAPSSTRFGDAPTDDVEDVDIEEVDDSDAPWP